jgi:hypothetical protein
MRAMYREIPSRQAKQGAALAAGFHNLWVAALGLAGLLLLAGCAGPGATGEVGSPTLAGNPRLPAQTIARFYSATEWEALKDRRYDGYAILRGPIGDDNRVTGPIVVESFPDKSRSNLALTLSRRVKIAPTTIGTHVRPTARVYVVFYETPKPRRAIIFAEQSGFTGPVNRFGGDQNRYLVTSYY